jgi:hypothetical protein
MANKKMGYIIFMVLFVGFAVSTYGQVTVSGGFAVSQATLDYQGYSDEGEFGIGGNVYVDYLLPIPIPLSVGGEVGVDTSTFENGGYKDTVLAIPLLARVAYHFDLFPKLDLYVVGKVGYVFGIWNGDTKDYLESQGGKLETEGGIAFGFDVGVAYYFTSILGVFAEAGFDRYAGRAKASGGGVSQTADVSFNRFFTVGISAKF